MKKLKLGLGLAALVMSSSIFADTIYVNNKQIAVESKKVNNSNYVPVRFITEALGATVEWQKPNIIIKKDEMVMRLTLDNNIVNVNGQDFSIDVMPTLINNMTYVPLRIISEQLNCEINYVGDSQEKRVYITSKGKAFATPVASLTQDIKQYILSDNELWGISVAPRYYPNGAEHVMYLKNMKTGLYKEIYTTDVMYHSDYVSGAYWQRDNQLVIIGTRGLNGEADNPRIMLYNPETGNFKDVVRDIQGAKKDGVDILFKKIGETKYYAYHLVDGTIETNKDIQQRGEKAFAPV